MKGSIVIAKSKWVELDRELGTLRFENRQLKEERDEMVRLARAGYGVPWWKQIGPAWRRCEDIVVLADLPPRTYHYGTYPEGNGNGAPGNAQGLPPTIVIEDDAD